MGEGGCCSFCVYNNAVGEWIGRWSSWVSNLSSIWIGVTRRCCVWASRWNDIEKLKVAYSGCLFLFCLGGGDVRDWYLSHVPKCLCNSFFLRDGNIGGGWSQNKKCYEVIEFKEVALLKHNPPIAQVSYSRNAKFIFEMFKKKTLIQIWEENGCHLLNNGSLKELTYFLWLALCNRLQWIPFFFLR